MRIVEKWIHPLKCKPQLGQPQVNFDWWVRERREWFGRARGPGRKTALGQGR
jgi:hypothetical protein